MKMPVFHHILLHPEIRDNSTRHPPPLEHAMGGVCCRDTERTILPRLSGLYMYLGFLSNGGRPLYAIFRPNNLHELCRGEGVGAK
jgi:hypothetical protein